MDDCKSCEIKSRKLCKNVAYDGFWDQFRCLEKNKMVFDDKDCEDCQKFVRKDD